jgi:PAS domain S-box-containing protein
MADVRGIIRALRQWPRCSLANAFALRAASMVLLSVLVMAGVSVGIFYWTEVRSIDSELGRKAERAVERIESQVGVLEKDVAEFAKSPAFTTAMVDSSGRNAYLEPFLRNYSFPVFARTGLALCDVNGLRLVGTLALSDCHATLPQFQHAVADGHVRRTLVHNENGRHLWLVFQGVASAYTGTTEGVAVAQIDLDDLVEPLVADLNLASLDLDTRAGPRTFNPAPGLSGSVLTLPLLADKTAPGSAPVYLIVRSRPLSGWDKLVPLLAAYFVTTLILVSVILLWTQRNSRRLVAPLVELRDQAREIARSKDLTLPIPCTGCDEVGQLAKSLRTMVEAISSATETRREAEERFRLIFEKSSEAILFSWPDGRIEAANPEACRLFGCSEEELLNLSREEIMDRADPRLQAAIEERSSTGSFPGELACRRQDGSIVPVEVVSTMFKNGSGERRVSIFLRDITKRVQLERERCEAMQHMAALSRRLIAVQEDARRRLARELHDRTSPNLAAIGINLEVTAMALQDRDWDEIAARMGDNGVLIDDTAQSIRDICADLRPPVLDHAGLVPAIEHYASQFARRTGVSARIECVGREVRVTAELESMLFRIFQEALTNTAKHARATAITVELVLDGDPIRLSMTDDGDGFDPASLGGASGQGLINMREMAEFFGGTFMYRTAPGGGTRIYVEIPLSST